MSQTQVLPHIGRTYQHYKGGNYKVLLLGRDEDTQADVVVYAAEKDSQVWVRPLVEFQPPRFVELPAPHKPYEIPGAKDARRIAQHKLGYSHPLNTQDY